MIMLAIGETLACRTLLEAGTPEPMTGSIRECQTSTIAMLILLGYYYIPSPGCVPKRGS